MNTNDTAVLQAAHDFATAVGQSAQFCAFEKASERMQSDARVAEAVRAFQTRQHELMGEDLRLLPPEQQEELDRLRAAYYAIDTVEAYDKAKADLIALCQAAGDVLTRVSGMDFAGACQSGSCSCG